MTEMKLTKEVIHAISERFKALSNPHRLEILALLHKEDMSTVSELVELTGLTQGVVSNHLQILLSRGFVSYTKQGRFSQYGIADPSVGQLCDIMCQRLLTQANKRLEQLEPLKSGSLIPEKRST